MKKMLMILMLIILAVLPASADESFVRNPMPAEIADLFDVPAWENYHVMTDENGWQAWTYSESMDAGVVVMSNGSLHIVCLIEPDRKGNLRITQRNYKMVVGDEAPNVCVGMGNLEQEIALPWGEKLLFEIGTTDYMIGFGKFDGVWRIKVVLNNREQRLSFVYSERIGYRDGKNMEDYIDYEDNRMYYANGIYDNRFAAFNIYDFPKDLEAAREKLTNPPVTPTDFFMPDTVTLRANEKYDVFAAPGRDSYRAANGKAVMSTNDWVQIFGEEDGWLLVQYDISSDRMRFGYIDASALPRGTEVQRLAWLDLSGQIIRSSTYVTDDPLCSRSIIHTLNVGDTINVLSEFGSWYYIETSAHSGRALRGFVPKTAIDIISVDDMVG